VASLCSCLERKTGNKECGVAISYRFKLDDKGWRVFVSTPLSPPKTVTREGIGVIGIDINADHLAVVETDRYGNCIKHTVLPLVLYGKNSNQTKALVGDMACKLIALSIETKKPLVLEHLSFQKKKTTLREQATPKQSRMLSSFAYNSIRTAIQSRAFRFGVAVKGVNPAYTSLIGRVCFAKRYGLSIHESAAFCIARRFLRASEKLPRRLDNIPDGKNGYVALSLPARNRDKHVWTSWRLVQKKLPVALAAHFRATKRRSSGRPEPACCDKKAFPDLAGEIPAHESSAALLG
jgi:IS605 OrfB family transposase